MSTPVDISIANPDPNDCPTTFTQLVTLLNTLISGTLTGDFSPYVISSTTPGVDDQEFVWFKVDGAGRPLGIYIFTEGNWRRMPNGSNGDLRVYVGPTQDRFDSNGLGLVGTDWDGWHICNGLDGTPDLSNLFMCGANMNGTDGVSPYEESVGWKTRVRGSGELNGGVSEITLDTTNTYRPDIPGIDVYRWGADGNEGRISGGNLYGDTSTPGQTANLFAPITGNTSPDAISTVPPFFAVALLTWVGYA